MTRLHPIWFNLVLGELGRREWSIAKKGKDSVGNVKLAMKVSCGLNLFHITNCQDALSQLSLQEPIYSSIDSTFYLSTYPSINHFWIDR